MLVCNTFMAKINSLNLDGMLYGVCQYEIDKSQLLSLLQYTVTPRVNGLALTWSGDTCDTCQGWRPSTVNVSSCFIR